MKAEKWDDFQKKHLAEWKGNEDAVCTLKDKMKKHKVTMACSAKDEEHNDAHVLKEFLEK